MISRLTARPEECFFWATHSGAELDLLVIRGNRRLGFEFKRTTVPTVTRSMRVALQGLVLDEIVIVHAGSRSFSLDPQIRAVALGQIFEQVSPLP